jgi:hypothetical protein
MLKKSIEYWFIIWEVSRNMLVLITPHHIGNRMYFSFFVSSNKGLICFTNEGYIFMGAMFTL